LLWASPAPRLELRPPAWLYGTLGRGDRIEASQTPASDIVEAQWVAERRGLARFHTEQPPYSILNRGIERDVLPTAQRFGLGTLVWGPLGQGLLTGRVRRDHNELSRAGLFRHLTDERRLDVVEQLVPLAAEAGRPMTHLAMGSPSPTPASPARSSARGLKRTSTTCLPAWTSPSPTMCSTASTRSSRPVPTLVLSTRPISAGPRGLEPASPAPWRTRRGLSSLMRPRTAHAAKVTKVRREHSAAAGA
jgi:hypothetical protein